MARDALDSGDALGRGDVGEPRWPDDVADGVDAVYRGAIGLFVDHNVTFFGLDPDLLKAEVFDIALHTDGDEGLLPFQYPVLLLARCMNPDPRSALFDFSTGCW